MMRKHIIWTWIKWNEFNSKIGHSCYCCCCCTMHMHINAHNNVIHVAWICTIKNRTEILEFPFGGMHIAHSWPQPHIWIPFIAIVLIHWMHFCRFFLYLSAILCECICMLWYQLTLCPGIYEFSQCLACEPTFLYLHIKCYRYGLDKCA